MDWNKVIQAVIATAESRESLANEAQIKGNQGLVEYHLRRAVELREQAEFLAAGLSEVETGGVYSGGEGHETR